MNKNLFKHFEKYHEQISFPFKSDSSIERKKKLLKIDIYFHLKIAPNIKDKKVVELSEKAQEKSSGKLEIVFEKRKNSAFQQFYDWWKCIEERATKKSTSSSEGQQKHQRRHYYR